MSDSAGYILIIGVAIILKTVRPSLLLFLLLICPVITLGFSSTRKAFASDIQQVLSVESSIRDQAVIASFPTPTTSKSSTVPTPTAPWICRDRKGHVKTGALQSKLLTKPLEFRIYLPPCYNEQTQQRYPVLYLIHGQSYTDDQWDRLGVDETADDLIYAGDVQPFIIVMPRDRVWSQPTEDLFGQALTEELIPWVDSHYRTLVNRQSRAIGGLSRGGGWALHLGLSRQDLFSAIGLHSAAIFSTDVRRIPGWIDRILPGFTPRITIDIGDKDRPPIWNAITRFEDYLTERGFPHVWHLYPGYHDESYWQSHVEDYLRWYAEGWEVGG
jgi:enterochelin esterase-like enzyme